MSHLVDCWARDEPPLWAIKKCILSSYWTFVYLSWFNLVIRTYWILAACSIFSFKVQKIQWSSKVPISRSVTSEKSQDYHVQMSLYVRVCSIHLRGCLLSPCEIGSAFTLAIQNVALPVQGTANVAFARLKGVLFRSMSSSQLSIDLTLHP